MQEYEDFIANESRAYLDKARTIRNRIKVCDDMLEIVRRLAEPKGIDYASQPGSGVNKDAIADVVAAMDELSGAWRDERIRLMAELDEAVSTIYKVADAKLCVLLLRRYIYGEEWKDVASYIHFSESHCHVKHREALMAIHRFIPPMYRTDIPKAQ